MKFVNVFILEDAIEIFAGPELYSVLIDAVHNIVSSRKGSFYLHILNMFLLISLVIG